MQLVGHAPKDTSPAPGSAADLEPDEPSSDGEQSEPGPRSDRARFVRACLAGGLAGSVPFLMVLWDFWPRPLRTALPSGVFSNFYDIQARALMDGHLDVPAGALNIEAFLVDGREYMYFPPLPALLRIPVLAVTDSLDGRLTAPSMLLAWLLTVTMTALLIWRVRALVRPGSPLRRGEAWAYGILLAVVTGGSVLVYLAALPWVYHEAYMWSTAMAITFSYCLIRLLERPTTGRLIVAGAATLGCVLSRTTAGWAACLTMIAAAALLAFRSPARASGRRAIGVLAAGAVPLVIGIAINWAKFRHPFMFPLDAQVWTDLNEHRREALAANGGGLTGPQFFPSSLVNYFRPDGARVIPLFPYVTLPAEPARAVGGAFLDQTYRTGSVPAFMPLLFVLSIWGLVVTFRRRVTDGVALLRLPVLGAVAITGGVMFYGYIAHRYTAEFLPALVLLSTIGLVDATERAWTWPRWSRRLATVGLVGLAAFSVVANAAIGTATAGTVAGGEELQSLMRLRLNLSERSGNPLTRYLEHGSTLDGPAPADRMRIVGDCQAVYLATGEPYEPWRPVELRGVSLEVTATGSGEPGRLQLLEFDGAVQRSLMLDHGGHGIYRLIVARGTQDSLVGEWRALAPGEKLTVDVRTDAEQTVFVIDGAAYLDATVPTLEWNRNWIGLPNELQVDLPPLPLQQQRGATVSVRWHAQSDFCRRLAGGAS
jgi:hypothetical protein